MDQEKDKYEGATFTNTQNETEARLYKSTKGHLASNDGRGDLGTPPPPPMPTNIEQMNPIVAQPYPQTLALHQQQQAPTSTGTFPHFQRNPQANYNSMPRLAQATGPHRPQRLRVPTVMTTPTPQMGGLGQYGAGQVHPPPYCDPPTPGLRPDGVPIMQQPGHLNFNPGVMSGPIFSPGMMGGPNFTPGMMLASFDNGWASPSQTPVNCLPGLEYLAEIDQLLIHQQIELLEMVTGFETKNKYMIKNTLGQNVFFAAEESGCCNRQCLGESRPFDMNFYDHYGNVVMHMYRPLACSSCCCPCCLQSIEVSSPPGNVIGSIHQNWNMLFPRFSVKDVNGSTLMKIQGPFWTMSCCCKDVDFQIKTANAKMEIGKITKQWSGFIQETFTDVDNFSVSFPQDMDITAKALLLAAVFLIDFMYYEHSG